MNRFLNSISNVCFAVAGDPPPGTPPAAPPAAPPAGDPPPGTPPAVPPTVVPPAAPPTQANQLLNPAPPAPAAIPLTNITDPLQASLLQQKGWVGPDGNIDVAQLANGYYHANAMISSDNPQILRIPNEQTATPDDWNNVYKALGRPDAPADYQFDPGAEANDKMVAFGREFFHELGVPQNRIQGAVDKWNKFMGEMNEAQTTLTDTENATQLQALQAQMGPEWDTFVANGQRAVRALGVSDATLAAADAHVGTAALAEIFAKVGKAMPNEGALPGGQGGGSHDIAAMTPQMAQQEIDRLNTDTEFMKQYNGANETGHRDAVERMNRLFARVAAGRNAG